MNLKQFAGKVRHAVTGPEDSPEPATAGTERPLNWDAPEAGIDAMRPQAPPQPVHRPDAKLGTNKDPAQREPTKPEGRRPEIGRTADVRLGAETPEGTGRAGRWKASATVPDLATVYKEAGIESPLHGYGVDKLTDMLSSPHLASATREVRATAAQVALEAARVPLRDIIDDALLRSKALAAFEADKAFDLQASQMRAERRAQVLRDQVDVFRRQKNAEIDELKRTIDAADQSLAQLRARKRREQERLHRIVTHFVEPRPAVAAPPPIAARPAAPFPPPAPAVAPSTAVTTAPVTGPVTAPVSAPPSAPAISTPAGTSAVSPETRLAPMSAKPVTPASPVAAASPAAVSAEQAAAAAASKDRS
jgi:hypothetical protein